MSTFFARRAEFSVLDYIFDIKNRTSAIHLGQYLHRKLDVLNESQHITFITSLVMFNNKDALLNPIVFHVYLLISVSNQSVESKTPRMQAIQIQHYSCSILQSTLNREFLTTKVLKLFCVGHDSFLEIAKIQNVIEILFWDGKIWISALIIFYLELFIIFIFNQEFSILT